MNNSTIIEFGFLIIWSIVEIEEGVTQPHSLIVKQLIQLYYKIDQMRITWKI